MMAPQQTLHDGVPIFCQPELLVELVVNTYVYPEQRDKGK